MRTVYRRGLSLKRHLDQRIIARRQQREREQAFHHFIDEAVEHRAKLSWLYQEPHRLSKRRDCQCSLCRAQAYFTAFATTRQTTYRQLDRYEQTKWEGVPGDDWLFASVEAQAESCHARS